MNYLCRMALGKSILAVCYSLLVLLSGISWHVEEHHCMGRVMDRAILGDAESCGMEEAKALWAQTLPDGCDELSSDFQCCDDIAYGVEKQDEIHDQLVSLVALQAASDYALPTPPLVYSPLSDYPNSYRPPPLLAGRDRLSWIQVYLI